MQRWYLRQAVGHEHRFANDVLASEAVSNVHVSGTHRAILPTTQLPRAGLPHVRGLGEIRGASFVRDNTGQSLFAARNADDEETDDPRCEPRGLLTEVVYASMLQAFSYSSLLFPTFSYFFTTFSLEITKIKKKNTSERGVD